MGQEALFKGKLFGGFDRKNVMDYIEYLQNKLIEAEKNAGNSNLESDEEAFKRENEKLSAFIEELEEKNSLLKDENEKLSIKCRQLEESLSEANRESDKSDNKSEADKVEKQLKEESGAEAFDIENAFAEDEFEEKELAENDLFSSDEDDYSHIEFTVERISEEVLTQEESEASGETEYANKKNDIEFVDDVQDSDKDSEEEKIGDDEIEDDEDFWEDDETTYSAEVARLIEKYTNNRQRGRKDV